MAIVTSLQTGDVFNTPADPLPTPIFDMPKNLYPWSGLPPQHREGLLSSIMPQLKKAATEYPQALTDYTGRMTRGFGDVVRTEGQGLLNQLAGRNVLGSQVSGDAMVQLMKELNKQATGTMADVGVQAKTAYPGLLSQIAGLGRGGEDPSVPYRTFLNFLQNI